ncbi:G-protein coupled receptor 35-like isoform X2 [Numida meleagris]|nr:G-protein coupled receptor 35-like isoform X2 [Numida meleagris]XP_021249295.1 G-protein coupled receptor 35-like isoform X2 [Numida meleagris]XP_021249296.1 G-protein coupled receptor 35-like isoform X2 [Numida meleagris]
MNESKNCSLTDIEVNPHIRLTEFAIYILTFFFGAIFNALALWVFFCRMKKWTETRVYAINLVFADFVVICILPFIAYFILKNSVRNELCQFIEAMYFINMVVSIYIISFISVDRYMGIKHPLKARAYRSPSKAALLCGLLWLAVTVGSILKLQQRYAHFCFQYDNSTPTALMLLSIFFIFTLPLATLTFCSIEIIRNLKRQLKTSSLEEKSIRKALYIIYANLVVFLICFLPSHLILLVRLVTKDTESSCSLTHFVRNFSSMTRCIATFNCCLDCVCYYFVTKEFQEAILLPNSSMARTTQTRSLQTHVC